jgi:uncharacterized protein (DUF302 family)
MNNLQEAIHAKGQVVTRVRRVDVKLMTNGYQIAEYRLVFFGKQAEIRERLQPTRDSSLSLPLTIVVFAEGDDTSEFFKRPELLTRFGIREKDVRAIFDEVARNP